MVLVDWFNDVQTVRTHRVGPGLSGSRQLLAQVALSTTASLVLLLICTLCMLIVVRVCIFQDITGWGENDRGVSYTFGRDVVHDFLHRHRLSLIARAHQVSAPHLYTVSPVVYACHNKNGGINIAQRMLERKLNFLGHMRDAR